MLKGWVAPPPIVVGLLGVWRAEVGGGDGDCGGGAVLGVVDASDLVAGAAGEAIVEESSAQCRCLEAVALFEEIAVPAGSFCCQELEILVRASHAKKIVAITYFHLKLKLQYIDH